MDAVILEAQVEEHENGHTWFSATADFRLVNPSTSSAATVRVALRSLHPQGGRPVIEGVRVGQQGIAVDDGQAPAWGEFSVQVPANSNRMVSVRYRADLGATDFPDFHYDLAALNRAWPGQLRSARIDINFPSTTLSDQWLKIEPDRYRFDGRTLTWSFDAWLPSAALQLHFIRFSTWRHLQELRQAGDERILEFAQLLSHLTQQGEIGDPVFERFYPQAVAALHQTLELRPELNGPHYLLAQLYRLRALRPGGALDPAYVALTASEAERARQRGYDDPRLVRWLVESYSFLAANARDQKDWELAEHYVRKLEELQSGEQLNDINLRALERERQALYLAWARDLLSLGDAAGARQVTSRGLGGVDLEAATEPRALFLAWRGEVRVEPNRRVIKLAGLADAEHWAAAEAALEQVAAALENARLQSTAPEMILWIEVSDDDTTSLQVQLQRLAAAVPNRPDWALLRGLLRADGLSWEATDHLLQREVHLREQVLLAEVARTWREAASQLEQDAVRAQEAASNNGLSGVHAALQATFWRSDAQTWANLVRNTQVRYTLALQPNFGPEVERSWLVGLNENVELELRAQEHHTGRLGLLGGGAVVLLLLVGFAVWRAS